MKQVGEKKKSFFPMLLWHFMSELFWICDGSAQEYLLLYL